MKMLSSPCGVFNKSFVLDLLPVVLLFRLARHKRNDEEDGQQSRNHSPYDDAGERLLGLCSDFCCDCCGEQAEAGGEAGHDYGAHLVEAAFFEAVHGAFFALSAAD